MAATMRLGGPRVVTSPRRVPTASVLRGRSTPRLASSSANRGAPLNPTSAPAPNPTTPPRQHRCRAIGATGAAGATGAMGATSPSSLPGVGSGSSGCQSDRCVLVRVRACIHLVGYLDPDCDVAEEDATLNPKTPNP